MREIFTYGSVGGAPGNQCFYPEADALMSGFAVFSLKDPSLLAFDERREADGNLETIYHIKKAPCDTQMRTILDEVNPEEIRPAYKNIFRELQRGKALEPMVFFQGCYLLTLDGTGYFSSKKLFSDNCLKKVSKKTGEITYYQSRPGRDSSRSQGGNSFSARTHNQARRPEQE